MSDILDTARIRGWFECEMCSSKVEVLSIPMYLLKAKKEYLSQLSIPLHMHVCLDGKYAPSTRFRIKYEEEKDER